MNQKIEVPLSKTKITLLFLGSIVFVVIGIWFVIGSVIYAGGWFLDGAMVTGIIAIVFFGMCAIAAAIKLFDQKPGLVIDELGITDNSSGVSAGKILWSDVQEISTVEITGRKYIAIELKDPLNFIHQQKSDYKKKLMNINYRIGCSPANISAGTLKISHSELFQVIRQYYMLSSAVATDRSIGY